MPGRRVRAVRNPQSSGIALSLSESLPSTKPYLVRAIHEWCSDNGFTPYVSVIVDRRTVVPREFIKDGQIVLNVGHEATGKLQITNDALQCTARFNGIARELWVPMDRIAAIYARENGAGMGFEVEDSVVEPAADAAIAQPVSGDENVRSGDSPEVEPDRPPPSGRPRLQRVK
jgi:stringent starvation protein B